MIDPGSPTFTSTPAAADRPLFDYASAPVDDEAAVTIVTRVTDDVPSLLVETAASLRRQSFQEWQWVVIDSTASGLSRSVRLADDEADDRIRVVGDKDRTAVELSQRFVLDLSPGDLLEPTALEKWLWFLVSHSQCSSVRGLHVVFGTEHHLGSADDKNPEIGTVPEYLAWTRSYASGERARELPRLRRLKSASEAQPPIELERLPLRNPLRKRRRRLLLTVPYVTPGGADKFSLDLVAQLVKRGWEVTVVCTLPNENAWLPRIARMTPDVFALPSFVRPEYFPLFMRYLIDSRQPDVLLLSNSLFAYTALPYLRVAARQVAVADYCHSVDESWLDGGYAALSVRANRVLDLHITSSEALKNWMVQRGGSARRIEVCYIGTEHIQVSPRPSRAHLALPAKRPIILYACRITQEKQPAVFAKTLLELRRRRVTFLALVVGDGPYLRWLQHFVARHSLGTCVLFFGAQPNERVRELISVADCVFLPSKSEGISAVLYEALAEGTPVVSADVGGQRELVSPDCGFLLPRADEQTEVRRYADVLSELLRHPERRRRMGEAGRMRIHNQFTLDTMGARMERLLSLAVEFARSDPQPSPSPEQAREAALEAVRVASWNVPGAVSRAPYSWRVRFALVRGLAVVGNPIYKICLRLGLHRIERLKERVVAVLLPKGT